MAGASGKKLDETYKLAWLRGLKTTYYLRTLAATSAEKSTGKGGELNAVSRRHGGGVERQAAGSAQAPSEASDGRGMAQALRSTIRRARRASEAGESRRRRRARLDVTEVRC